MKKSLRLFEGIVFVAMLLILVSGPTTALGQGPLPENLVRLNNVFVANGQSFAYPVLLQNDVPLCRVIVPLVLQPGAYITTDSISFAGGRFDGLGIVSQIINNANHTLYISFDGYPNARLPIGSGTIATFYFTIAQNAPTHDIVVDTSAISPTLGGSFSMMDTLMHELSDRMFFKGTIHVITRRPVIHLDPDSFNFYTSVDVNPPSQTLQITNLGENPLNWRITAKPSWINISAMSGTAPSSLDIMPDVTSLPAGSYFDSIAVTDTTALLKTVWARVHLDIFVAPLPNLAGVVHDTDGAPISGATVEIWDVFPTGSVLYSMPTTSEGRFGFFGVPAGNYFLYAYKDGFYPTKLNVSAPDTNSLVILVPTPPIHPTTEWISLYCNENYFENHLLPKGTVVEALDHVGVVCGQFFVHEVGKYGFMPVYRDDPFTPDFDEGADSNEVLTMRINSFGASAYPTPVWTYNGDIQQVCLNTNIIVTRCIPLHQGWNLVSWNVDTPDDRTEVTTAGITDCIDVILGFEMGAATYDPKMPQFSTLKHLDHLHGYWFRMVCDTQLCVTGNKVEPATPIDLEASWNLVSYLPEDQDSVPHALTTVYDKLIVALGYDQGALTHDPAHANLSTLDVLRPEFGYWLKTTGPATLVYPGPILGSGQYPVVQPATKSYPPMAGVTATPEWIDLYGEGITLDGTLIPAGSTLAVYDANDHLCGEAIVQQDGKLDFTPVYGDDKSTPAVEGPEHGDRVSLTVNGTPVQQTLTFSSLGDRIALGALTSLTEGAQTIPRSYELAQNFPNPFNPGTVIEFSLPAAAKASVEVYNVLGDRVNSLVDRYLPAGKYRVNWDGVDSDGKPVASGVYFYRLNAGDFSDTRKMLLVK